MRDATPSPTGKVSVVYAQMRIALQALLEGKQEFINFNMKKKEKLRLKEALAFKPVDDMGGDAGKLAASQSGVSKDVLNDLIRQAVNKQTREQAARIKELEAKVNGKNSKTSNKSSKPKKGGPNAKAATKSRPSGDFRSANNAAGRSNANTKKRGGAAGKGNGSSGAGGKKKTAPSNDKRGGKKPTSRNAKRN